MSSEWISVEESMPEYDTQILLGNPQWPRAYVGYWRHSDEWIGSFPPERMEPLPTTDPTHWQPLPSPPKEQP